LVKIAENDFDVWILVLTFRWQTGCRQIVAPPFFCCQATIKNGKRFSTAKAFLKPALYRKNLHIVLNAYVTKVLLSEPPYNK
jgi:choline dehydrogenase-like flavoprotein